MAQSKNPDQYTVLVGVNYPPNDTRARPGDVISDLPNVYADPLVQAGVLEPVAVTKAKAAKAQEEAKAQALAAEGEPIPPADETPEGGEE